MKNHSNLIGRLAFFAALQPCLIRADWKVHPANEYQKQEVRVWDPASELKLDFNWTGEVNARNEAEGEGELTWQPGGESSAEPVSIYSGTLKAGKREGSGSWYHRSGAKYSGAWVNNVKEGQGEYWLSDGSHYTGSFKNDQMEGRGKWSSPDGSTYEGGFVAGKRNGAGVLTLPGGVRHESIWEADKDTAKTPPGPSEPYLALNVDTTKYALTGKVFKDNSGSSFESYLTYRGRWQDNVFQIESDWPYRERWSKGGPIGGSEAMSPFDVGVHPAFVELRVFNPTKQKLSVTKAEIVVDRSDPDMEPILDIGASPEGGMLCFIRNFNANQVQGCEVSYNIQTAGSKPLFSDYKFTEKIPDFKKSASFSVEQSLGVLGVDIKSINSAEKLPPEDWNAEAAAAAAYQKKKATYVQLMAKAFGKFGSFDEEESRYTAEGVVSGELRLKWIDHLSVQQAKTVRFTYHQIFYVSGSEFGAGGPGSGAYDIVFNNKGKNYAKPFAYKRTIAPGANDRITLKLAADISSYHSFRIRLTTADGGEILTPECRLHFLLPAGFSWKKGFTTEKE